ncbi:MAG: alpha-L-fucosidase [Clostridia bacterium]|nr:alpha-L-fucosidase [Clostridia bacterium]
MAETKIRKAWCFGNNGYEKNGTEVERLTSVFPSKRQLEFLSMEYYNFIHFGMNTITNREWGDGSENPEIFNPKNLNTDQWCEVLKKTGSKGIIITAKHHDGFCLWNTKYTDHSVMNSPYGKDIVKQLQKSCEKYGLKMGIYLSPWDRHEKTYGTEEYNNFFVSQLKELATQYGKIFTFWFDGACGEGKNGKKQVYDWERYYSVIRELQPDAVISICGPDVRWIGNEGGRVRKSEWSVVPANSASNEKIMRESQQSEAQGKKMTVIDTDEDLGSRELLKGFSQLVFKPAEADVSINYGWFHCSKPFSHARKKRSAKMLSEIYFNTVGANASMLLNVPPDRSGRINKREIRRLEEFTRLINEPFKNKIDCEIFAEGEKQRRKIDFSKSLVFEDDDYGFSFVLEKSGEIKTVVLKEELSLSQRIEAFEVFAEIRGENKRVFEGTVIGSKRIIRLKDSIKTKKITVVITQSRGNPAIKTAELYG